LLRQAQGGASPARVRKVEQAGCFGGRLCVKLGIVVEVTYDGMVVRQVKLAVSSSWLFRLPLLFLERVFAFCALFSTVCMYGVLFLNHIIIPGEGMLGYEPLPDHQTCCTVKTCTPPTTTRQPPPPRTQMYTHTHNHHRTNTHTVTKSYVAFPTRRCTHKHTCTQSARVLFSQKESCTYASDLEQREALMRI
jgi:hypothetical protein